MKKITYLLTLLLLIVGGNESAFAAVDWGLSASSLESITANQTVVIKEAPSSLSGWSSNSYMNSGSNQVVSAVDYSCIYKFVKNGTVNQGGTDYQVYVLYNLATGKYLAGENSYTKNINDAFQMVPAHAVTATSDAINGSTEWTDYYNKTSLSLSAQTETLWTLCKKDGKQWLNFVGNPGVQSYHDTNLWLIYSVEESKIPAAGLARAQEVACAEVDALAPLTSLTTLFSVDADVLKTNINAVTVTGDDVSAAIAQINSIVRTAFNVNNKSIIFSNLGGSGRTGLHITAGKLDGSDVSKAYGTASTDKNKTVWTLKDNGNGTFKLYNAFSGLYLGTAASAGALSATASDGANFTFVVRGTNQVSLKDHAGNIFHQLSYWSPNYSFKEHNSDDNASNWTIESVTIADEELIASYKANKARLLSFAYPYFQDKYGLVKDAAKMSVVVIETEHAGDAKPVSNLLDGNLSTFVHSSYGSDKGTDPHYIQVELSEAQQYIMFYMAKRDDGTNNNRPATIKVYVSSDGTDFGTEPVATLENLHLLGNPYYSPQINLGAAYKYVRFVVSETNTNTQFFTASEFYVLPINDETAVLSAQNDVTTINDVVLNFQNTLLAKAELYAPMNEANALLADHASNHADVPALGQYTTTAYNNLQTVVSNNPTLAELEEALDVFDKAQNRPVFLFTSANDGAYCNNGTIYDEGSSWRWMTKNYYDKRMFFTVKDLTATELTAGTAYNMYNYATGRSMFYDGTVTPEAVSGKEGVYNLKVNTGNGYLHCQGNGAALVTWHPCVPLQAGGYDRMASAWRIEYLGNSYDFDQKTDFPVSANELMGIQLNCTAANFGSGLGQYSGVDYSAVEAANAAVEALKARENAKRYSITNSEITSAIAAVNNSLAGATLNQPAPHKFYRFKNLSSNKYLTSTLTGNSMTMSAAGDTPESVFYLTEDNKLLSYKEGLFTKNFTTGNYGFEAAGHAGHAVVFAQGNPVTAASSCYHITCGNRSIYGKNATLDAGGNINTNNTDTGYDWTIEEVTWLPIPVSNTYRFGTLTTPVDLAIVDQWYAKDARLKFYIAAVDPADDYVVLTQVTENIPAGQSYVIEYVSDKGYQYGCSYLKIAESAPAIEGTNELRGSFETIATPTDQGTIYTLQPAWVESEDDNHNSATDVAFRQYNGTNIQGFRAYLPVASGVQPAGIRFYEGDVTRIEGVEEGQTHKVDVYDLSGRRVQRATKGLYIVNGKKVLIK